MYSAKEFKENIATVSAIMEITGLYQEIASLRVRQLREGVAKTREFLDGVSEVYHHTKASFIAALQRQQALRGKADWRKADFIKRNGKTILVLLSANEHLYGGLILDIWHRFIADLRRGGREAAVVGSIGKYFMRNEKIKVPTAYFDLDDDKPTPEQIKKITSFIGRYEEIIVYHGRVISILHQLPIKREISGGATLGERVEKAKSYLFEPSPEKILEFFETEIIAALFHQTIYEHQLARFAARMVAMDQATENAKEILGKLNREWRNLRRQISNRRQLETLAGLLLWGRVEE